MKKYIALLLLVLVASMNVWAQRDHCTGWNNPSNFLLTGGDANTQYSGKTGTKPSQAFSCMGSGTLGVNLTTDVTAAGLATATDAGSSSYCGATVEGSKRFRIMHSSDYSNGNDPLVGNNPPLPVVPPASFGNYNSSIRIGNCQTNAYAEALYYDMDVDSYNSLLIINYAIVVQAPGHGTNGDPVFSIRILKQTGSTWQQISDTLCYMVSSTPSSNGGSVTINQNGWHSTGSGYDAVYYRDWDKVAVSLMKYYGQRIRVEISMGDCSASGHYGYCYISGDCQPMALNGSGCASGGSDTVTTLTAPEGLAGYTWYCSQIGRIDDVNDANDINNYRQISDPGTNTNVLGVRSSYFSPSNRDTVFMQTTILCRMTSSLDPSKPFYSFVRTNLDNVKPVVSVDTIMDCFGNITLSDASAAFSDQGGTGVDATHTDWSFYDTPNVGRNSIVVGTGHGPTATHHYNQKGNHCVRIRTYSASDSTCFSEKDIRIRSLMAPTPTIRFSKDIICADSLVTLFDDTHDTIGIGANAQDYRTIWRQWHVFNNNGYDTTIVQNGSDYSVTLKLYDTCTVELLCHVNYPYSMDTNGDGRVERIYCDGMATRTIFVEAPPKLKVLGDTVVCNGSRSEVSVQASLPNCTFDWYKGSINGELVQQNSPIYVSMPTSDIKYYVHATSQNGCQSWDSITIGLVKQSLDYWTKYGRPEICEGDTAILWGGRAMGYTWSTDLGDADATLWNQEHADTIKVTPSQTTVYSVVGHGAGDCTTSPMSQKIVVHPYPIIGIRLTPDYIDSDNPSVQFSDTSRYATQSLWTFGDGNSSTTRSVVYTFTDLSQDSILITLRTANPLGCYRDTAFYIPVGIFTVWYPNAFTPRMDDNNVFRAFTNNELVDYELNIYNRGGALVFHSTDPAEEWDGTYKGQDCMQGAYVYIATYRRPGVERLIFQKGTVMLIR